MKKTLAAAAALGAVAAHDLVQRRHAILRNYPVIGHARFWLESIGPELRQYIVAGNDEERPFSRDQRRWVYASAKLQNNYFGFGTDNDLEHSPATSSCTTAPSAAPTPPTGPSARRHGCPSAKVLGAAARAAARVPPRLRGQRVRHELRVAVGQRRRGASTGAPPRPAACTTPARAPSRRTTATAPTWSSRSAPPTSAAATRTAGSTCPAQGARRRARRSGRSRSSSARAPSPGSAACCPAAKVSREIAETRGVPEGVDCISPSRHAEFDDVDSHARLRRAARRRDRSPGRHQVGRRRPGLLAGPRRPRWRATDRGVDFISIDGGEGGTGASPLIFTDAVSLPFRLGFARVYAEFAEPRAATRTSRSSAPASSACPTTPSSPSRSAPTWSTSRARRCSRSAASRHRSATPASAPPASPPSTRGSPTASTPPTRPSASPTTSRPCVATCSRSSETCGVEHPASSGPTRVEVLDTLSRGPAARRGLRLRARLGLSLGAGSRRDRPRSWPPPTRRRPRPRGRPRRPRPGRAPTKRRRRD